MDRNREGRRGGAAGGGAMSNNNNKRRRQEQHPQAYDREETSEDGTEMGSAAGCCEEDDDDDLPPSMVPRHGWKLKQHHGKSQEDASPVDLAAPVPRKLRTAMMKRYQDSPPHVCDSPKQQPSNVGVPCNLGSPAAHSNSAAFSASLKSGRRTKSNSHNKPRPAKLPKISPSKQEVEVAETLYDLARMFTIQKVPSMTMQESKVEPKLEVKPEVKLGPADSVVSLPTSAVQSPQSTQCAQSPGLGPSVTAVNCPSPTHTPGPSGAQKRKRQRVSSKVKDGGQHVASAAASPCLSTSSIGVAAELLDAEQVQLQIEASRSPSAGLIAAPEKAFITDSSSSSTNVSAPPLPSKPPQIVENDSATLGEKVPNVETGSDAPAEFTSIKVSSGVADKSCDTVENSIASKALTKVDIKERLVQSTPAEGACPAKFEIDLMSPPKAGDDKGDDTLNLSMGDVQEKIEVDLPMIPAVAENTLLEKDSEKDKLKNQSMNMEIGKQAEQTIEKTEHDCCKDLEPNKNCEKFRESADQIGSFKEREKQDVDKQGPKEGNKNAKADLSVQAVDGSGMLEPSASVLATSTITATANSVTNIPFSISMGVAGWSGGIPPPRYCSPAAEAGVAAAWSTPISVASASSEEKSAVTPHLPSLSLNTRQSWKRSETHMYIARFIYFQQQANRNPLWAAAYGNSTGVYGASAYNLNIPIAPTDAIFGNSTGGVSMGVSASNAPGLGGRAPRLGVECLNEMGVCPTPAAANGQGTVDRSPSTYIDALGKRTLLQQQIQTEPQQLTSTYQGGSTFGFPITQSAAVSGIGNSIGTGITAGDNKGLNAAMLISGTSGSINSLSVGTGSGSTNGGVANVAAAQFLHSVIQHPAFPFTFPPGHFGPTFGGHLPSQQATQFFGNPFYGAQLVQPPAPPPQSPQVLNVTSEATDSQKQQHQHSQSVCSFASSGSAQQHSWSPSHGTQTPVGSAPQQPQQLNGKESMAEDGVSASELKLPMVHRNVYSQNQSSMQVPTTTSSSSVLATGMPVLPVRPQDFSLVAAFGAKQTGKLQPQAEMHLQSHHHSMSHLQQQQHQLQAATQHHVAIPALQISLKDVESHTSQSLPTTSINRGSPSPSFLGVPAVTSVMVPQGHTFFHSTVDPVRGHVQLPMSIHNQSVSGQSHQLFMSASQQQQQRPAQMQRLVSNSSEDNRTNTNESSYSKGGHGEDRKAAFKHQLNQSYLARGDVEASAYIQGTSATGTGSLANNGGSPRNLMIPSSEDGMSVSVSMSIPAQQPIQSSKKQTVRSKAASSSIVSSAPAETNLAAYSDRSPVHAANIASVHLGQVLPFPGQTVDAANQCTRQGHTQQLPHVKVTQRASVGLPLPPTSATPPQVMLAAMGRNQGQQSKNEQSATDIIPTSRTISVPSVSSFCGATPLPHPLPVSKSGGTAVSKSGSSTKDSYCLPQKPSSGAASMKRNSPAIAPNVASILGPGPLAQNLSPKSPQIQMIQNQHIIQQQPQQQLKKQQQKQQQRKQQQMTQPLPQQSVQSVVSAQQQLQQQQQHYHLQQTLPNQQHVHQLHKQALTQQQQLQIRQHFLAQQNPQSGQTSSQTQHLGNMPQQHLKHLQQHQQILPTPFGMAVNGGLPATLTLGTNAGNSPRSIVSDGMVISQTASLRSTSSKSTVNTNVPSPASQRINSSGSVFLHSDYGSVNSAPSSQQQVSNSNSNTVFPSFSNPVAQPVSISGTFGKLNDDKPMKGN